MLRAEHQLAYLLHLRPYRDTSAIVELFTENYGRIALVARGVRSSKNAKRQLLTPFHALLVSFQGSSDLKLLTHMESSQPHYFFTGKRLYSALYLNELIVRLLPEMDAHPQLFAGYQVALEALHKDEDLEPLLRRFEFFLLQELGYSISFTHQANHIDPIIAEAFYACDLEQGFFEIDPADGNYHLSIKGEDILAIAQGDYHKLSSRKAAKVLSRYLLKPLLGNKPLKSRELFIQH
jgi:DNA repair protein RecO (recombination protein O)